MFDKRHIRFLLSVFITLPLLLIGAGAPGASISEATTAAPDVVASVPAAAPCNLAVPYDANTFTNPTNINNQWFPLVPGTQLTLEGRVNVGGDRLDHQVILIVTDLTKVVHGVRSVVLWDRDFNIGVLTESELTFHAQDNSGNIWNLGEYPEEYKGGTFTGAPDTWISGLKSAQGGMIIPGAPQTGTPKYLQAYAPNIIGDCGQVASLGQQVCNVTGCYDNVLVIDETSPPEAGTQQKYYAPGVGNFQIGATDNDPQGETLVLSETLQLSQDECIAARQAALGLEAHANQVSPNVYGKTVSMESTGLCETLQPTAVPPTATPPTEIPTETPVGTPPAETPITTPIPTPQSAPSLNAYLPLVIKDNPPPPTATPEPTIAPTPTLPPAIFNDCKDDPNPASAPNVPVRIVKVDKVAEVVTLQNVSNKTVSVEDWNMCSINGNQEHDQIFGTLAAGQTRDFPNTGDGPIWNDSERDNGAIYNAAGFLVSYWIDQ